MTFHDDKAYIIVNNSAKIEIADASTFKSTGVINGLKLPRYMAVLNNKAYVSCWVKADYANRTAGEIAVIDLNTNTVVKTIPVGWLPERLLITNNKVFVTNSNENTVSIINAATDQVENTLTVGDSPNSLVTDAAGKLWVLGAGNYITNSVSKLHRINPVTNTIEAGHDFPYGSAEDLIINDTRNTMYYSFGGQVFRMGIAESTLPATPFINRYFYGIGIDPETNSIYGADAGKFDSNGKAIRYSATGQAIDSFTVGVIPNDFYFR
jgi:YVTN family beta-propeller protein